MATNRNCFLRSRVKTNCTHRLHRLQRPSKIMIGLSFTIHRSNRAPSYESKSRGHNYSRLDSSGGRGGEHHALRPPTTNYLGNTTLSMTWTTPLLASTSVLTTFAPFTVTEPSATMMSRSCPLTVLAFIVFTSAAMTFPATTW